MHYLMASGSLLLAALLTIREMRETSTASPWRSLWRIGLIGLAFVTIVRA